MTAQKYLKLFPTTCVFHEGDTPCGLPAAAIYVTADHLHIARYLCISHGVRAEREGDGPVFWQKPEAIKEEEEES